MKPPTRDQVHWTLALSGILAVAVFGIVLRLEDPLSTTVIPAEDPYNHMALVREHVHDGSLDPLNPGAQLYPPGMHALLAAVWVFTGAELYTIFRFAAVFMGTIGILGMALLAARVAGPLAGFLAAAGTALMPELIFRATMTSPTAVDLAILPFLILALMHIFHGRFRWLAAAAPMLLFLVFTHPWLTAILGAAVGLAAGMALALPTRRRLSLRGVAAGLSVCGSALAMAAWGCHDACGPGFGTVGAFPGSSILLASPLILLALAATPLLVFLLPTSARRRVFSPRGRVSMVAGAIGILGIGAAGISLVWVGLRSGLAEFVDPMAMFGWPIMGLAAAALIALPFIRHMAAYTAAGLSIVMAPFVFLGQWGAWFLPHRTAVYLGFGMVLLAAFAVAWAVGMTAAASDRLGRRQHTPRRHKLIMRGAAPLVAGLLLASTVVAATPGPYPGGWYRLYPECEFEALREVATTASPDTILITGSWQSKLVIAAFAPDADNVWYKPEFILDGRDRADTLGGVASNGQSLIVVGDRYQLEQHPGTDWSFVENDVWETTQGWCGSEVWDPRVVAASTEGGPA